MKSVLKEPRQGSRALEETFEMEMKAKSYTNNVATKTELLKIANES